MKYFFDTEFLDDGRTLELISIGIVCEDDRELYLVSSDFDEATATPWLRDHVLNHIPKSLVRTPRWSIAAQVSNFLDLQRNVPEAPELYGWYSAYDWVVLCQLYGPMINRPKHFPKLCHDLKTIFTDFGITKPGPKPGLTKHNALDDAKWVKHAWDTMLIKGTP